MILSVENAKSHMRILHDDEDVLIASYILAAENYAEIYMNQVLESADFEVRLPCVQNGFAFPKQPVSEIVKVEVMAQDGNYEILPTDNYRFYDDFGVKKLHIEVASHKAHHEAIKITFKAGFEDTKLPATVLQWIKCAVSELYENRELDESKFLKSFAMHLLKQHRLTLR